MPNKIGEHQDLEPGHITIKDILSISTQYYGTPHVGDKSAKTIDILMAKITHRKNLIYNKETGKFEQAKNKSVKFIFMVHSKPITYQPKDDLPVHKYPVTFIIDDWEKGFNSTFRWRTGSDIKPKMSKIMPKDAPEHVKVGVRSANQKRLNWNIQHMVNLGFFFELEYCLHSYRLLYGPNFATHPPRMKNKLNIPYYDKEAYYVVMEALRYMLGSRRDVVDQALFVNPARKDG